VREHARPRGHARVRLGAVHCGARAGGRGAAETRQRFANRRDHTAARALMTAAERKRRRPCAFGTPCCVPRRARRPDRVRRSHQSRSGRSWSAGSACSGPAGACGRPPGDESVGAKRSMRASALSCKCSSRRSAPGSAAGVSRCVQPAARRRLRRRVRRPAAGAAAAAVGHGVVSPQLCLTPGSRTARGTHHAGEREDGKSLLHCCCRATVVAHSCCGEEEQREGDGAADARGRRTCVLPGPK
jgi:hypothetical protein